MASIHFELKFHHVLLLPFDILFTNENQVCFQFKQLNAFVVNYMQRKTWSIKIWAKEGLLWSTMQVPISLEMKFDLKIVNVEGQMQSQ